MQTDGVTDQSGRYESKSFRFLSLETLPPLRSLGPYWGSLMRRERGLDGGELEG